MQVNILIVPEHEPPDAHGDRKGNGSKDVSCRTLGGYEHRGKAEYRRYRVQNGDSLLLVKTHVQQLVVEMPAVGMEGTLPVQNAAGEGKKRVRKRDGQRQHRQDKGHDGVELEHADDRCRCEDVPQQQSARVAHENLCRIKVIRDKADAGAAQRGEYRRNIAVGVGNEHRHDEHSQRCDGGNAAGKSVKPVDEINGVCAADYPQYRHGDGKYADGDGLRARYMQGIGDDIYDDAREHRNDGGEYLHAELEPCVEVKNIVYRTDDGDEYRTD